MSHPTEPPAPSDDPLHYVAAADDYAPVLQLSEEDDDEDDESSSGDGDSQGFKSKKKYEVILDPILEFADEDELSEEENAITKLNKLGFAPMSFLVSGASAFASENDLSRKVFMAEIGLVNREIALRDIADPKLFQKMDAKQAERRATFGIKTLDDIVAGTVGAAAMLAGVVASSVADFVKDKREERRVERRIRDYESGKEEYALDSEDDFEARSSMTQADFPVLEDQAEDLSERMRALQERLDSASSVQTPLTSFADIVEAEDNQKRQTIAFTQPTGEVDLAGMFNALATRTLAEQVQTLKLSGKLSDDISIGQDQQRVVPTQFDPMGGR